MAAFVLLFGIPTAVAAPGNLPDQTDHIAQEKKALKAGADAGLEQRWSELRQTTATISYDQAKALGHLLAAGENFASCPRQASEGDQRLWLEKLSALQLGYELEARLAARNRLTSRRAAMATASSPTENPIDVQSCNVALEAARQVLAEMPAFAASPVVSDPFSSRPIGRSANSDIAAPLRASQAANQSVSKGEDDQFRKLFNDWQNFHESGVPALAGVAQAAASQVRRDSPSSARARTPVAPIVRQRPAGGTYYANCAAVRAAGASPLLRGSRGYRAGLDRDGDGRACE